jgi:hypothetical protein
MKRPQWLFRTQRSRRSGAIAASSASGPLEWRVIELLEENIKLLEENERLRSSLKPVMIVPALLRCASAGLAIASLDFMRGRG